MAQIIRREMISAIENVELQYCTQINCYYLSVNNHIFFKAIYCAIKKFNAPSKSDLLVINLSIKIIFSHFYVRETLYFINLLHIVVCYIIIIRTNYDNYHKRKASFCLH